MNYVGVCTVSIIAAGEWLDNHAAANADLLMTRLWVRHYLKASALMYRMVHGQYCHWSKRTCSA